MAGSGADFETRVQTGAAHNQAGGCTREVCGLPETAVWMLAESPSSVLDRFVRRQPLQLLQPRAFKPGKLAAVNFYNRPAPAPDAGDKENAPPAAKLPHLRLLGAHKPAASLALPTPAVGARRMPR